MEILEKEAVKKEFIFRPFFFHNPSSIRNRPWYFSFKRVSHTTRAILVKDQITSALLQAFHSFVLPSAYMLLP